MAAENLLANITSDNSNTSEFAIPQPEMSPFSQFVCIMYGIICVFGVAGNGIVIIVLLRSKAMDKNITNVYIFNLAIADLLFLLSLPMTIYYMATFAWVFGEVMCKIFYPLTLLNFFTGVFFLVVMAGDRYLAVCHAIASRDYRTKKYGICMALVVWTISLAPVSPVFLMSSTSSYGGRTTCDFGFMSDNPAAFVWYNLAFGYIAPLVIITVLYSFIICRVSNLGPTSASASAEQRRKKVTRMVLSVILAYALCWLPYQCFQLRVLYGSIQITLLERRLFAIFQILGYCNSALNPVLYTFLNEGFREQLRSLFVCSIKVRRNSKVLCEKTGFEMSGKRRTAVRLSLVRRQYLPPPPIEGTNSTMGTRASPIRKGFEEIELTTPLNSHQQCLSVQPAAASDSELI